MKQDWRQATRLGDLAQVRWLLEQGADINAKDEHGQTALMNAAHAGQTDLVRLLIEYGADLNITAKYNLSALMLSLLGRHPEVAQMLIEAGADLNLQSSHAFLEKRALTLAEDGGYGDIASLLRERGAN
jgi:ankyrin repeat protein